MTEVPIVHCFDHNYVLPAGVAFRSLLAHARHADVMYVLYVIGSGLTDDDKALLDGIVGKFENARLEFLPPPELPLPKLKRGNFSRDMFYKMLVPDLLPQYDTVLVSDVDVVYAGDVADLYFELDGDENYYVCGTADVGYASWRGHGILKDMGAPKFFRRYFKKMSQAERDRLVMGVGFFAMNARLCRRDGMGRKWMDFAIGNFSRLLLPEQDIINICCHPKIKLVGSRYMAIAGFEPAYRSLTAEERAANPAWNEMFANPVQIHYASGIKPWKYPQSACSKQWFEACLDAGLFDRWRDWYARFMQPYTQMTMGKKLVDCAIPLGRGRKLHLRLHKEKAI